MYGNAGAVPSAEQRLFAFCSMSWAVLVVGIKN